MNKLLAIVCLVASTSIHVGAQAAARDTRPSVILILMDDLGYGDIGSYGVKDARTPNLDRLARDGVRLTDAYSNGANCSPTRTGLISGQYQ
jgi:arylsulfatase A-like enzyme